MPIRSQCPERYDFLADSTVLYTLAERCTLTLEPAAIATGVRAIRAIPELTDELNRVIGDVGSKVDAVDVQVRNTRVLRARIVAAESR